MIVSALLTSLGINLGLLGLFFALYSVLRKQSANAAVYSPRQVAKGRERHRSQFNIKDLLPSPEWLCGAWQPSEDELLESCGLDTVVFMRIFIFRFDGDNQLASEKYKRGGRKTPNFSGPLMLPNRASANSLSAPMRSSGGYGDFFEDKSKGNVVQSKGQFSITSEHVDLVKNIPVNTTSWRSSQTLVAMVQRKPQAPAPGYPPPGYYGQRQGGAYPPPGYPPGYMK